MKIKKVHLNSFIQVLINLYNKGVDYVDISKLKEDDGGSAVGISFVQEYMSDEVKNSPIVLTEDIINQLL
jgi:hypothetical protein